MVPVPQKRLRVLGITEIVTVIALHVDDRIAKIPAADQVPHASCGMTELGVVPHRQLPLSPLRERDQFLGFLRVQRERLLHVHVTPMLQALPRDLEMALRRCGDVDDVGRGLDQELAEILEVSFDLEALRQLPRHQLFAVADADDVAPRNPPNLRGVRVGNPPASDDRHPKRHRALASESSRSIASGLRPSPLSVSSRGVSSPSRSYSGSPSSTHAMWAD